MWNTDQYSLHDAAVIDHLAALACYVSLLSYEVSSCSEHCAYQGDALDGLDQEHKQPGRHVKTVKVRKNPVKVERGIKRKVEILPYMQVRITQAAVPEPPMKRTCMKKKRQRRRQTQRRAQEG